MLLERNHAAGVHANDHPPEPCPRDEALKQKLADMQALLAAAAKPKALTLKVSEKGQSRSTALDASHHPLSRPDGAAPRYHLTIQAFITTNSALLATKP